MENFKSEKISVITVVYNDLDNLKKTIKNIHEQTYDNIEYIVIDGASTDGCVDECNKNKEIIDIFISEQDNGIYNAMNKGIRNASGDWIIFMNAGDIFYENSVLENFIKNKKDADIYYGKTLTSEGKISYYPKKISRCTFLLERMVCHQSIIAKRNVFVENMFDEKFKIIADRIWLYRAYDRGDKICSLPSYVAVYDTNGVSSNIEKFDKESMLFMRQLGIFYYYFAKFKRILRKIKIT